MKKAISILTLFVALFSFALAQSTYPLPSPVGIGINSTSDDLHIHEATLSPYNPGVEPLDEGFRDDPLLEGYYSTTIRLTNGSTSFGAYDGFLIEQFFDEVKMQQLENANYTLYGYSGLGLQIHKSGRIGIADTSRPEYKVNVGGNTHIKGNIYVDTKVVSGYGEFSESVLIAGMAKVGTGFECSQAGQVKAKSIKVTLDGWSDFVFDEDYRLPSLYELEKYVTTNRHLPDIPSAKEVEDNGVDLGEMNAKLLQKVEELTLYVIDLQKQIDGLKNK